MTTITIDASEIMAFGARFKNAMPVVRRELTVAMDRSTTQVLHDGQAVAKVDQGTLRRSLTRTVTPFLGRVGTNLPYARGRRPNQPMPPKGSLLGWMSRHGIAAEREFVIRRAIGRKGMPPNVDLEMVLGRNRRAIEREFALAADRALKALAA